MTGIVAPELRLGASKRFLGRAVIVIAARPMLVIVLVWLVCGHRSNSHQRPGRVNTLP
jgi:hypothetical protein